MQRGICLLSVIPCRREPAGTSEMVTQLLFGEHYSVTELKEDWMKIVTAIDSYECWISAKQHASINESEFKRLQEQPKVYASDLFSLIGNTTGNLHFPLCIGAVLPDYHNGRLKIGEQAFVFEGGTVPEVKKTIASELLATAFTLLNAPYLWGGRTPLGIDCSGFTQLVYKLHGMQLPRDAYQQVQLGQALSFVEEAEAGDLAFFDNEEGKIVHVGIVLDNQQIIHASGQVRIDKYDHYGIFNGDSGKYSHYLRVIKRVIQ